jgi:hypothetical protein
MDMISWEGSQADQLPQGADNTSTSSSLNRAV